MPPRYSSEQRRPRARKHGRRRSGTALVELALVFPFLALLLLGVFDLGRAFAEQLAAPNAARAAARQNRRRRERRRTHGQALVELALTFPLLALLLLATFDIGRAFAEQVAVTNAAREGARYAKHDCNLNDVQSVVISEVGSTVTLAPSNIVVNRDWQVAQAVTVTVTYQHSILFGLFDNIGQNGHLDVGVHATMPYSTSTIICP